MARSMADMAGSSRWGVLLAGVRRLPVTAASSQPAIVASKTPMLWGSAYVSVGVVEVSLRQPVGDVELPAVWRHGSRPYEHKTMTISDRVGPWGQGAHHYRNNVLHIDVLIYVRHSYRFTIRRAGGRGRGSFGPSP